MAEHYGPLTVIRILPLYVGICGYVQVTSSDHRLSGFCLLPSVFRRVLLIVQCDFVSVGPVEPSLEMFYFSVFNIPASGRHMLKITGRNHCSTSLRTIAFSCTLSLSLWFGGVVGAVTEHHFFQRHAYIERHGKMNIRNILMHVGQCIAVRSDLIPVYSGNPKIRQ